MEETQMQAPAISYYSGGDDDLSVVDVPSQDHSSEENSYRMDKPIRIKAWVYAVYCFELKQRLEQDPIHATLKFVPDHHNFDAKPKKIGDGRLASIYNDIYKMLHLRETRKNTLEFEEMPDPLTIPSKTKEYKASIRRIADLKKQINFAIEFVYQLTRTPPDSWANVTTSRGFQKKWRSTLVKQDEEWKDVRLTLMAIKSNRDTTALAGHYPPAARNHPLVNGVPMGVPGLGSLPPSRGIEDVNPDFFVDVNSQLIGRPSKRSKLLSEHGDDEFKHLVMALERTDKVIEDLGRNVTNSIDKMCDGIMTSAKLRLFTELSKAGHVSDERTKDVAQQFSEFLHSFH